MNFAQCRTGSPLIAEYNELPVENLLSEDPVEESIRRWSSQAKKVADMLAVSACFFCCASSLFTWKDTFTRTKSYFILGTFARSPFRFGLRKVVA